MICIHASFSIVSFLSPLRYTIVIIVLLMLFIIINHNVVGLFNILHHVWILLLLLEIMLIIAVVLLQVRRYWNTGSIFALLGHEHGTQVLGAV